MRLYDTTFADIFDFYNGKAIRSIEQGDIPIYGSNGVIGLSNSALYKNAIILGRVGAYCGSVMRCKEEFWASDNTIVVKPKREKADIDYCFYLLISQNLNNYAGGAAQPLITQSTLKRIDIKVPDINTQRRIADILSAYDDLIENHRKQIKLLEEAAMRLYKEWFVHLRFPGNENTRIVDGVPEGWIRSKTKEFIKFSYGKALKAADRKGNKYPVYGSSGIVGYHESYIVEAPVIIVGRKGNIGSVYLSFENAYPIDTVYYVTTKLSLYYTYFELSSRTFVNSDSAVPGLNRVYAESMEMICPCEYIQNEFDKKISILFKRKNNLQRQIQLLQQARNKLLPKLMSGEIEV